MHSKIIQVGTDPIPKVEWVGESQFYDGFVGWIADYVADDLSSDERAYIIDDFCDEMKKRFPDYVEISPKMIPATERFITFKKGFREAFLNGMKCRLKAIAKESQSLDTFYKIRAMLIGITGDQFGTYIYEEGWGLSTEQRFLETVEEDTSYYFGSVIDYHY